MLIRGAASLDTSANRVTAAFACKGDIFAVLGRFSSMNEFQPLHSGQRPSHLADVYPSYQYLRDLAVYPQLWHSKMVGAFVILFQNLKSRFGFVYVVDSTWCLLTN